MSKVAILQHVIYVKKKESNTKNWKKSDLVLIEDLKDSLSITNIIKRDKLLFKSSQGILILKKQIIYWI